MEHWTALGSPLGVLGTLLESRPYIRSPSALLVFVYRLLSDFGRFDEHLTQQFWSNVTYSKLLPASAYDSSLQHIKCKKLQNR